MIYLTSVRKIRKLRTYVPIGLVVSYKLFYGTEYIDPLNQYGPLPQKSEGIKPDNN